MDRRSRVSWISCFPACRRRSTKRRARRVNNKPPLLLPRRQPRPRHHRRLVKVWVIAPYPEDMSFRWHSDRFRDMSNCIERARETDENLDNAPQSTLRTGSASDEHPSKRQRGQTYTPRLRSGIYLHLLYLAWYLLPFLVPYAVVMALRKSNEPMSKTDLLDKAIKFCDFNGVCGHPVSFLAPTHSVLGGKR